mgnify:CR=1 FL=1
MTAAIAPSALNWATLKPYLPLLVALWIAEVTGSFEAAMILAAMRPLLQDFGDPVAIGWLISTFGIVGAASASCPATFSPRVRSGLSRVRAR